MPNQQGVGGKKGKKTQILKFRNRSVRLVHESISSRDAGHVLVNWRRINQFGSYISVMLIRLLRLGKDLPDRLCTYSALRFSRTSDLKL